MPPVLQILIHTPLWVAALFAILAAFGIQALRTRTVSVRRLLIVPAVFIVWGVSSVMLRASAAPWLLLVWLGAGAIGAAIVWRLSHRNVFRFDRPSGLVTLPGSALPLVRNLSIFAAKYVLGVALAVAPALHARLVPWDIAVSGISAGYFAGWLLQLGRAWREAPDFVAGAVQRG